MPRAKVSFDELRGGGAERLEPRNVRTVSPTLRRQPRRGGSHAISAGYRLGMTLTAADRQRFRPVIAAHVDELEDGVRQTTTVDELEEFACQASVRFQGAQAPDGVAEMLVAELARRGTPDAVTVLASFARLCASDMASASRRALDRLDPPDGALDVRIAELGLLRPIATVKLFSSGALKWRKKPVSLSPGPPCSRINGGLATLSPRSITH